MPADPRRVKDLFVAALELTDPQARQALLERECAADPDLRRRLDVLLAAHDHPESALERPLAGPDRPANPVVTAAHTPSAEAVGAIVAGRYKLLEAIGEGGMGQVWVADQLEPIRRRVALKVIKPGMDSRPILARFEAERQALALMNHPNIAKVLDAGTTEDGRPFFVMELVKGTPITDFCDARRLTARERLELFVPVCQAIQHAHQKGVIHRDIKPTNVLVELYDDRAVPKVIDFGIAKAVGQRLTEKTLYTGFGTLVGTPAYMAPEQATFNALDVDTRADVYALGVLLYELLAGSPPFEPERLRQAALDEVLRLVREEEPPRPSTRLSTSQARATIAAVRRSDPDKLARLVRGELDWIVMKALEKDRTRRYETAAGLGNDVERFLKDEPVEACPPTLGYRIRKAYRKNRAAVVTATAVLVGALLAAAGQTWNMLLARAAEADAVAARVAEAEQRDETARQRDAALAAGREVARQRDETNAALGKLRLAQEEQQANQYVWDMQMLPLAFEAGNLAEVSRLLGRHVPPSGQPDRRGFEWFYWDRQLHTDLRTDRLLAADGSKGDGFWVASPDGTRVARFTTPLPASVPPDDAPALTVWDVATRTVLLTHRMPVKKPANQSYITSSSRNTLFSRDGKRVSIAWGIFSSGTATTEVGWQYVRQVLDATTGKVLLDLKGANAWAGPTTRAPIDAAFSPDGRRFAVVCRAPGKDKLPGPAQVRVWDVESGTEAGPPLDADGLADSPFSPDGTALVTRKTNRPSGRVSVWDVATGTERKGWDVEGVTAPVVVCSPDGTRVAGVMGENPTAEPHTVKIWDAATGTDVLTLSLPGRGGVAANVVHSVRLFFSPDGARLAAERYNGAAGGRVSDFTVWDARSGKQLPPREGHLASETAREVGATTFSPDGKQLLATDGATLRTWDVDTGTPVRTLRGHLNPIAARAFFPDGQRLWSLETGGGIKEWDARPPAPLAIPFVVAGRFDPGTGIADLSADGGRVAALIDGHHGKERPYAVGVWDAGGTPVKTLVPPPRGPGPPSGTPYYHVSLSRDGRRALLARADPTPFGQRDTPAAPPDLTVWDVDAGTVLFHQVLEGRDRVVAAIAPDGRTVAATPRVPERGGQPSVRLFDVDDGRELAPIRLPDRKMPFGLGFSPDGRRLVVSVVNVNVRQPLASEFSLVVWDVASGATLCTVEERTGGPLEATMPAWAPDGSRFAVGHPRGDSLVIEVHDAATGEAVLTLEQPLVTGPGTFPAHHLAYSPDGKRIAGYCLPWSAGAPPTLKVWEAAGGKPLLTVRLPAGEVGGAARHLTFSNDGRRLLLAEPVSDRRAAGLGSAKSLLITTWDATPRPDREPKKP